MILSTEFGVFQLLGSSTPDPHRGSAAGPRWETVTPQLCPQPLTPGDATGDHPLGFQTVGSRVFTVVGPRSAWNAVREETTSAPSLTISCQRLKTWLFRVTILYTLSLSSDPTSLYSYILSY